MLGTYEKLYRATLNTPPGEEPEIDYSANEADTELLTIIIENAQKGEKYYEQNHR